jgi:hypothetical protein
MNDSDLNWLAFRYITGEMAETEVAAFEQSLAESQPAREAVAAAVRLAQAVTLCESAQTSASSGPIRAAATIPPATWRGRLVWALLGAAATVLFASGLQMWRDAKAPPNVVARNRPAAAENLSELALQWTAAGGFEFDAADNGSSERRSFDDSSDTGHGSLIMSELFDDVSAPDWLVAALSSEEHPPMMPPTQNPDG